MLVPEVAQYLPKIRALCQEYGVKRMSIIGSATNKEKFSPQTSDVDGLVEFLKEEDSDKKLLSLTKDLKKICQRPVELLLERILENYQENHPLRQIVEKSKVLIYDSSHDCA